MGLILTKVDGRTLIISNKYPLFIQEQASMVTFCHTFMNRLVTVPFCIQIAIDTDYSIYHYNGNILYVKDRGLLCRPYTTNSYYLK